MAGYQTPQYVENKKGCGGCYIPIWLIIFFLCALGGIALGSQDEDTTYKSGYQGVTGSYHFK